MNKTNIPLMGGIISAFLSAICCIVPLLLLMLGIGGSWMVNLTSLAPYKPIFIIIASILLVISYQKIFLQKQDCANNKPCAVTINNDKYKIIFWIAVALVLSSATVSLWSPLFY